MPCSRRLALLALVLVVVACDSEHTGLAMQDAAVQGGGRDAEAVGMSADSHVPDGAASVPTDAGGDAETTMGDLDAAVDAAVGDGDGDAGDGSLPDPDAGGDAGTNGSEDAGEDAGGGGDDPDASMDAGEDASTEDPDAGEDAGADAGNDAGEDAGDGDAEVAVPDSGTGGEDEDAGEDPTPEDAGNDAGEDASSDAATDAGEPSECADGDTDANPCGYNDRGTQTRSCIAGHWSDFDTCDDDDVCFDDAERSEPCGWNDRGAKPQLCMVGEWNDLEECSDPDECEDTSLDTQPCGVNSRGEHTRVCSLGEWSEYGACDDDDVCEDDDEATRACGKNARGEGPHTCVLGAWQVTGECDDDDACVDGSYGMQACGYNDRGSEQTHCVEGQWQVTPGSCYDPDLCVDGDPTESVERCGVLDQGHFEATCVEGKPEASGPCNDPTQVRSLLEGDEFTTFTAREAFGDGVLFTKVYNAQPSLWRTDGTVLGTQQIHPQGQDPFVVGNVIFFFVRTEIFKIQLWRSDGTAEGSQALASFDSWEVDAKCRAGSRFMFGFSSDYQHTYVSDGTVDGTKQLTVEGATLSHGCVPIDGTRSLTTATTADHGREPWVTDGTAEGTHLLTDLVPGASGTSIYALSSGLYGGVYFVGPSDTLFRTNGESTTKLIHPYLSGVRETDVYDNKLLLITGFGELWEVDAFDVRRLEQRSYSPAFEITEGMPTESGPYFFSVDGDTDGQLWTTNAAEPGEAQYVLTVPWTSLPPRLLASVDKLALYKIHVGEGVDDHLWRSDGTEAGSYPVVGPDDAALAPAAVVRFGNRLLVAASQHLWVIDLK